MELVLHIGYARTGTTAIQHFLAANRAALARQGIYYPAAGAWEDAHHGLAMVMGQHPFGGPQDPGDAEAQLFDALRGEIDASGCDRIVLSTELFSIRFGEIQASPHARKFLDRCDSVRVVCFLRRPDTWIESCFAQQLWNSPDEPPGDKDEFISEFVHAANYHFALVQWQRLAGPEALRVVVYEQAEAGPGCVRSFCSLLGVDADAIGPGADRRVNARPSTAATEQLFQAMRGRNLSPEDRVELRNRIGRAAGPAPGRQNGRLFSAAQLARIESGLQEPNRRLAAEIVHQPLQGFWFAEKDGVA